MTTFKFIIVLLVLSVQLIQINGDNEEQADEQEFVNKTSDWAGGSVGSAGGVGNGRRRQQNKHRNNNDRNSTNTGNGNGNKNGWSVRRKNPNSNPNNNNPLEIDELENPLFPPRSDSFWKSEHQTTNSNAQNQSPPEIHPINKHHGKKNRQRIGPRNEREGSPSSPTGKLPEIRSTTERNPRTGKVTEDDMTDRPNIILIITDDQDIELGSMNYMPETLKEFRENGIEFRHGYVTTPMCCPSRSSMLTGLYVHNHQVYTNNDNCSSIQWRQKYEKKTFAYQLQESGYYTSYIGKYLNKYDGSHIPQGWSEWNTLLMNSRFYNYTVSRNGKRIRYGNNYEFDYYPDVVTNDTLDFLHRAGTPGEDMYPPNHSEDNENFSINSNRGTSSSDSDDSANISESEESLHFQNYNSNTNNKGSKKDVNNRGAGKNKNIPKKKPPFLLVVSYPSPHGPEDSAPQYSQLFFNATPHHTPSYNYAPNLDKQWILRVTDKMTNQLKNFTNLLMAKRLQTLQSVDVAMKQIFDKLRATNLIDNTFIFYTSDHGYHVGQFGLIKGKSMPYEFDIRVPFFVRVPQNYRGHLKNQNSNLHPGRDTETTDEHEHEFPGRGLLINEPVLNVDLSPTFLEIGRVSIPPWIDGRSMLPLIHHYCEKDAKRSFVNQTSSSDFPNWGHTFIIESSGRREPLVSNNGNGGNVNMNSNTQSQGNFKKRKFSRHNNNNNNPNHDHVQDIHTSPRDDQTDEDETLQNLCLMHPYPCLPRQKKYCKLQNGRVRFRKCRIGIDYEAPILSFVSYGNSTGVKCSCKSHNRNRRSTTTAISASSSVGFPRWDWDEERLKIDQEIDELKNKIESLREKRKRLRVEWLMGMNNGDFGQSVSRFSNTTSTTKVRGSRKEKSGREFKLRPQDLDGPVILPEVVRTSTPESVTSTSSNSNQNAAMAGGRSRPDISRSDTSIRNKNKNKMTVNPTPDFEEDDEVDQSSKEAELTDDDDDEDRITSPVFHNSDEDTGSHDDADDDDLITDDRDFIQHSNQRLGGKGHKNRFGHHGSRGKHRKQQQQHPHNAKIGKNRGKISVSVLPPSPIPVPTDSEDEDNSSNCDCSYSPRLLRQMERDERKRRKLMSKIRKKQRFLNRIEDPNVRLQAETCGTEEKMNCFWHDNDHWRTPPLWTDGSFCFCMNANNNTYTCLRSINATHDYLYCHFMTGFKMFFNLREDPHELHNLIGTLPASAEDWMLNQLFHLKKCQGSKDCWLGIRGSGSDIISGANNEEMVSLEPTIWEQIFGRWKGKRKSRNGRKQKQF